MGTHLGAVSSKPEIKPPRIVVHGKGGVGKTSFGASAPAPIFVPLEDGLGALEVAHFQRPGCLADVYNMVGELVNEEHAYRTVVFDTIDHLEPLVWHEVCRAAGKDHIEDFGYGKGYAKADPLWIRFFRGLDILREKGLTTVVLCHDDAKNVDDPVIGSHTRRSPKLHKRANALLYEWADVVGYLDIETVARDVGKDGGRTTRTAASTGERILHLEDSGAFTAKNRFDLPAQIRLPKTNPYQAFRAELAKALGVNEKEAA